jgi:hypothetical protein
LPAVVLEREHHAAPHRLEDRLLDEEWIPLARPQAADH